MLVGILQLFPLDGPNKHGISLAISRSLFFLKDLFGKLPKKIMEYLKFSKKIMEYFKIPLKLLGFPLKTLVFE